MVQFSDACVVVFKAVYIAGIALQQLGKHIMAVLIGGPYRVKFLLYAEQMEWRKGRPFEFIVGEDLFANFVVHGDELHFIQI